MQLRLRGGVFAKPGRGGPTHRNRERGATCRGIPIAFGLAGGHCQVHSPDRIAEMASLRRLTLEQAAATWKGLFA